MLLPECDGLKRVTQLIGVIALFSSTSCVGKSPANVVSFQVFDVDTDKIQTVDITDRSKIARFCGCSPCIEFANALLPEQRQLIDLILFW